MRQKWNILFEQVLEVFFERQFQQFRINFSVRVVSLTGKTCTYRPEALTVLIQKSRGSSGALLCYRKSTDSTPKKASIQG